MSARSRDDDELDRLLEQARWPLPDEGQMARLAEHWRGLRARRRRRLALAGLTMAAGVAFVAVVVAWRSMETAPEPAVSRADPKPRRHSPAERTTDAPKSSSVIVPRDPNLYEQVVLLRAFRKRATNDAARPKILDLDELILAGALGNDHTADVDELLASLGGDVGRIERRLWKVVREGRDAERLGAARLLARIGTSRSVPVLIGLAGDPATHEPAVLGLARLAPDRDVAQLVRREGDAELRRRLLAGLLARGTPDAVGHFLGFVSTPDSRAEALSVLSATERPPADVLLAYLESPQGSMRLAAAFALSRISDPTVVERLCESVGGIGRQEALMALLLNRSQQAAGCVNHARTDLYLVASLRAAERQLDSLQIPRGGLP